MVKHLISRIFRATTRGKGAASTATPNHHEGAGADSESGTTSFDRAIELTGFGRFNFILLLLCGLSIMAAILEMLNIGYVLSAAACDFGLTQNDKGILGAITYIGIICSAHMWGVLGDTKGRLRMMIVSLLADAVVSTVAGLSPNFGTLVFFRFLNGVCVSACSSLSYAYLGEFNTPTNRNRLIVLVGLITGCSALILPALAWAILPLDFALPLYGSGMEYKPWRLFLMLCATPSLLAGLLLFFFMPESPKFLLAVGRKQEALQVLARVHAINSGGSSEYPVRELTEDTSSIIARSTDRSLLTILRVIWAQTAPLFQRAFLLHTILACVIQFGNIASASGLLMWLPELFNYQSAYSLLYSSTDATICESVEGVLDYNSTTSNLVSLRAPDNATSVLKELLTELRSHSDDLLSTTTTCEGSTLSTEVYINSLIIGAADVMVPVLGSLVVNTVGKRNLLVFSLAISGIAAVSINFVKPYAAILTLACVVISFTGMCIAHMSSIVVDMFPTNLRGMAVSLSLMCGRMGSMTGSLIFGSLLDQYCDAAFYFYGGLLILCAICGLMLPKRGKYA